MYISNETMDSFSVQTFDSLDEMMDFIKQSNKQKVKKLSTMKKLKIDITNISDKHQNGFMEDKDIQTPNPMDVISLHNEILEGNISVNHYGKNMVEKIDKLFHTLKSYIDNVCVNDKSIEYSMNLEVDNSENFYYITKELSQHFFTDIYKINQHRKTLTKLSYGMDYYIQRDSLVSMYVSLYIESTLDVGSKGNM